MTSTSKTRTRYGTILIGLYLASSVLAADFTGTVRSVGGGDTIDILHHGKAERIHLNVINCSEKGPAYVKRAKQAIKYGRTIADIPLPDGTEGNFTLVKEG